MIYPAIAGAVLARKGTVITSLLLQSIGLVASDKDVPSGLLPPLTAYDATTAPASSVTHLSIRCILDTGDADLRAEGIRWASPELPIYMSHDYRRRIGDVSDLARVPAGETLPDGSVRDRVTLVGTLNITDKNVRCLLEAK